MSDEPWEMELFPAWARPFARAGNPDTPKMVVVNLETNSVIEGIQVTNEPYGLALIVSPNPFTRWRWKAPMWIWRE